jgi:hypothetical protein
MSTSLCRLFFAFVIGLHRNIFIYHNLKFSSPQFQTSLAKFTPQKTSCIVFLSTHSHPEVSTRNLSPCVFFHYLDLPRVHVSYTKLPNHFQLHKSTFLCHSHSSLPVSILLLRLYIYSSWAHGHSVFTQTCLSNHNPFPHIVCLPFYTNVSICQPQSPSLISV